MPLAFSRRVALALRASEVRFGDSGFSGCRGGAQGLGSSIEGAQLLSSRFWSVRLGLQGLRKGGLGFRV